MHNVRAGRLKTHRKAQTQIPQAIFLSLTLKRPAQFCNLRPCGVKRPHNIMDGD